MKNKLIFLFALSVLIFSSCSPKIMNLTHSLSDNVQKHESSGTLKVQLFEDSRPDEEKIGNKTFPLNDYHQPVFNEFITNSIKEEIENGTKFTLSNDQSEYELQGKITSFKLIAKPNGLFWFGYGTAMIYVFGNALLTASGSFIGLIPSLIIGGGSIASLLLSKYKTATIVSFDYQLLKDGQVVLDSSVTVNKVDKIFIYSFQHINKRFNSMLDSALTDAIYQMFDQISTKDSQ